MLGLLGACLVVPLAFGHVPPAAALRPLQAITGLSPAVLAPGGRPTAAPAAPGQPTGGPAHGLLPGVPGGVGSPGSPSGAGAAPGPAGPAGLTGVGTGGAAAGRTASDVGVTADTVTLGVFLIDLSAARKAGVNVAAYDPEQQKIYWNAFIADANSRGGANGRRIVPAFETVDVLDNSTFAAQCKQITETDHAFAVTNILGFYGPPILCITRDHQTPWLAYDDLVSSYYAASQGRAFTVGPSTLRTELNLAARLEASGELTDAAGQPKKIGYLHEDGYLNDDNRTVMACLASRGHVVTEGLHSSSSSTNAATDLQIAAQKMCAAGDTAVFLATNSIYAPQFVRDVTAQPGCAPEYLTSDFDFEMAGDTFLTGASGMPAQFYDRALSVTSSRVGEGRTGNPEPAVDARCRSVFEHAPGGTPLDRNSTANALYFTVISACSLVQSFVAGMQGAGLNPTRSSFSSALAQRGGFDNPGFGASSFTPDRTNGPTQVRIARAFADCGDGSAKPCWKPLEGFQPAAY